MRYLIKCDGCNKVLPMFKTNQGEYDLPRETVGSIYPGSQETWVYVDSMDLCPKCYNVHGELYTKMRREFIKAVSSPQTEEQYK